MAKNAQLETYVSSLLSQTPKEIKDNLDLVQSSYKNIDKIKLRSNLKYVWIAPSQTSMWDWISNIIASIKNNQNSSVQEKALANALQRFQDFLNDDHYQTINTTLSEVRDQLDAAILVLKQTFDAILTTNEQLVEKAYLVQVLDEIKALYTSTTTEATKRFGSTFSEAEIEEAQKRVKLKKDLDTLYNTAKANIDNNDTVVTLSELVTSLLN